MKKVNCIATLFGVGLTMVSWAALAQVPAVQRADTPAVAAPAAIPADQQATKEQLGKLFELLRIREQVASMTKILPSVIQQQMKAQMEQMQKNNPKLAPMTEEQQQVFTRITNKYMERVMDLYKSDEMIADMTGLYQKYMTRSDVDGIIAFYGSPAGQHLLDMQPVILKEYLPLIMQRVQNRVMALSDEMNKEMTEIIKSKSPSTDKPTQK